MRRLRVRSGAHVNVVAYSPLGERIYALSGNTGEPQAHAWVLSTGKEVQGNRFPRKADALAVARRADLIAVGRPQAVDLFSVQRSGDTSVPLPGGNLTMALALSDDGATVAMSRGVIAQSPNMQSQIGIERIGRERRRTEFHALSLAFDLDFSPGGEFLVSSGVRGFTVWDVQHEESILARQLTGAHSARFGPDERMLVVSASEFVTVWDTATGAQRFSLVGHRLPVRCLALSPEGRILASGGLDRTIRFWDLASATSLRTYDWNIGPVHTIAFAPDGLTCAAGGESGEVVIWDVED